MAVRVKEATDCDLERAQLPVVRSVLGVATRLKQPVPVSAPRRLQPKRRATARISLLPRVKIALRKKSSGVGSLSSVADCYMISSDTNTRKDTTELDRSTNTRNSRVAYDSIEDQKDHGSSGKDFGIMTTSMNSLMARIKTKSGEEDIELLSPGTSGSAAMYEPLSPGDATSSSLTLSTLANTVNALLGASIFAMPWGFKQSGLLGGSVIVLIVASLSFETLRSLLYIQRILYQRTGEIKSYPEISLVALGPFWASATTAATIISCLGGCVGYLIFFGEIMSVLFPVSLQASILISSLPLILLSWIRSFKEMTIFTLFGVLAILVSIVAIVMDGFVRREDSETIDKIVLFAPETYLNFLGPATFLFTVHYCVLSMGAESLSAGEDGTRDGSKSDAESDVEAANDVISSDDLQQSQVHQSSIVKPLSLSYALSALLIIFFGCTSMLYFGSAEYVRNESGDIEPGCEDRVCQNIVLNLSDGVVKNVVGVSLCVAIILSYILILAPAREHIERYLVRITTSKAPSLLVSDARVELFRNVVRTLLVLFTAFVAITSPYFGDVLGTVGGVTDSLQSFVLPPVILYRLLKEKLTPFQKIAYSGIFLGGCYMIITTLHKLVLLLTS